MRYLSTFRMAKLQGLTIPCASENTEEPKHSYTANGNAKPANHFKKEFGHFLNSKYTPTNDPAAPLLSIMQEK